MGDFKKLQTLSAQASTISETTEERYWKKLVPLSDAGRDVKDIAFSGPVTDVAFLHNDTLDFIATSGARVCIYDGKTAALKRTLARFKDVACGTSARYDGKLIASGCKNSQVYVFDALRGQLLRVLKDHKAAVQSTNWATTGSFLLTCSDDRSVKFWDVSTGEVLSTFLGHEDQVRSCAHLSEIDDLGPNVWATGSYDHTVRLWDTRERSRAALMKLDQDVPVEDILAHPNKPILMAASGNKVRAFDVRGGGKLLKEISDHQKNITTLFIDSTNTRMLSGSLDGIIKVNDLETYECTAGIVIGGLGVLSGAISPNNSTLIAGCASGNVVIRRRAASTKAVTNNVNNAILEASEPAGGVKRYYMRGGAVGPSDGDYRVLVKKTKRLSAVDRSLAKFNYRQALDDVLNTRAPVLVVSLLEELKNRKGLDAALRNRDDVHLEPLLSFLNKYVTNPRFSRILVEVCEVILDLYGDQVGRNVAVDELFVKLSHRLSEELRIQTNLSKLSGSIDLLLSAGKNTP